MLKIQSVLITISLTYDMVDLLIVKFSIDLSRLIQLVFLSSKLLLDFNLISQRAGQACAIWLYIQLFHFTVVDDHREPFRTEPTQWWQVSAEVQRLDKVATGIC